MAPKRRGRPPAAVAAPETEGQMEVEVASDNDEADTSDGGSQRNEEQQDQDQEEERHQIRFFNTTFSTFRVSPLYIARQALDPEGLQSLSRRLRDVLVGDVVRGVQISLGGDSSEPVLAGAGAGALERVEWRECDIGRILPGLVPQIKEKGKSVGTRGRGRGRKRAEAREDSSSTSKHHVLQLELEYENASFTALMLPRLDGDDGNENAPSWTRTRSTTTITISPTSEDHEKAEKDKFIHFPLLLVRMPAPLRAVLVDFLSSTFDCRISPLHLGTRTLVRSWEEWIRYNSDSDSDSVSGNNNNNNNVLLRKDLGLTLGFSIETPPSSSSVMKKNTDDIKADTTTTPLGLKTIDVVVPAEEVRRFLRIGTNTNTNTSISKKRARDDSHTPTHHHHPSRRRKLAGEEGWTWRNSHSQSQQHPSSPENANDPTTEKEIETESFPQPFTEALSLYLAHHLALDLFHPSVRVLRVVCDAFALSDGGRVKVFAPDMHTDKERREGSRTAGIEAFVRNLIHTAQGPGWSKSALRLAGLLGAAGT